MNWNKLFRKKDIEHLTREANVKQSGPTELRRALGVWDLTAFGVAAIVGAGVFSTIGNAAADGGPAVVFLFIFTALACTFSALCYAEFAASIPISGSAYTYAYASFGEMAAWIIGWDLLMEYAISNIAVAISWGQYFTGLLASYGVNIPQYLSMDYLSASRGYATVTTLLESGHTLEVLKTGTVANVTTAIIHSYEAWLLAPRVMGVPIICNFPALLITAIITWIVYIGIEESRRTSNLLVLLKVAVVLMVIAIGSVYIHPTNWVPFAPNGAHGVLKGVSAVFFAYIGFDAISTTAEECKNPQRDMPRGMIYSLIICTLLYTAVSLVLTGMMSYTKLGVSDPLAFIFGPDGANLPWVSAIVDVSAVIALSSGILVYQVGQPRIWMAMSRDGLLPPIFASIHPKYKTPWFSTIVTGFVVAIPSLFMNLTEVTDLTSIGTLFAFVLVCGGVLKLDPNRHRGGAKFRIPHFNSRIIFPTIVVIGLVLIICFERAWVTQYLSWTDPHHPGMPPWEVFLEKLPLGIYVISMVALTFLCITRNLSLIPVMGLATCGYLMTELGITNWLRFGIWLIVGFFVYFLYGVKHSKLTAFSK